jgi:hypothetical protein
MIQLVDQSGQRRETGASHLLCNVTSDVSEQLESTQALI